MVADVGDSKPFNQRPFLYSNFIIPLKFIPGHRQTIYLHVQSNGSKQFPLHLWSPQALAEKINKESFKYGLYYGIMLVMIAYNLFLYLSTKSSAHLLYVIYISCWTIFQMSLNGLSFEYLVPNHPEIFNILVPSCMGGVGLTLSFFATSFFEIPGNHTVPAPQPNLVGLRWFRGGSSWYLCQL